jgi:hypothetical protein
MFATKDLTQAQEKITIAKELAPGQNNKDLRTEIKEKILSKPEKHLSVGLWHQFNAGYTLDDYKNLNSTSKDTIGMINKKPDTIPDPKDNYYSHKKDWQAEYAEYLFKNKVRALADYNEEVAKYNNLNKANRHNITL